MNLYQQKKQWKWMLFGSAFVVFLIILYYSNVLLNEIAREERQKVNLWAEAVTQKAKLVNYTNHFFDEVKQEEAKRASQLATVIKKVYDAPLEEDLTFYVDVLQENKTIPLILTQMDGSISYTANVPEAVSKMRNIAEMQDELHTYERLKVYYDRPNYVVMYYRESKIYTDLREYMKNLQESFFEEIVINSASIPVIITDSTEQQIVMAGNIDSAQIATAAGRRSLIATMKNANKPLEIHLPDQGRCFVFYEESSILTRLRYFPYIQLFIILVFIVIAYLLFSFARRSEQNRVWVGMSKETAHQLGTPISSLMAWTELLRESNINQGIVEEMNKDVRRLETIAQRFSKIGSVPDLKEENLVEVIDKFVEYLRTRISSKTTIIFDTSRLEPIVLPINRYLFEWVIENLCKNAIDAMDGNGVIAIDITENGKQVHIDITDTGKGIPAKKQKTIFNPGYTSKSRGWGLGLTLARRIIKEYHKGKLFVKSSIVGKGTTMRISLKRRWRH